MPPCALFSLSVMCAEYETAVMLLPIHTLADALRYVRYHRIEQQSQPLR